jgi:hypothetical protein
LRRRAFIKLAGAAVAGAFTPSSAATSAEPKCTCDWSGAEKVWQKWVKHKIGCPLRTSWVCECGLVEYFRQPDGEYSASHILINGVPTRFDYGLSRYHQRVHERMWAKELGMTHEEWFEWRWRGGPGPK